MGATFTKINGVLVDTFGASVDTGLYADPLFATTYAPNLAAPLSTVASTGGLFRGMPINVSLMTGMIVPPSAASSTSIGVLVDDLTSYVIAKGTKIAFARKGKVRSYAAGALAVGDPVKVDTAAGFSGFKKWVTGTDGAELFKGYAFPIDDGSAENGASAASTMAQGDTIFVVLS